MQVTVKTKRCTSGKHWVPFGFFAKNKVKADGKQSSCKPCVKIINQRSYLKTKGYQNPKRAANKKIFLDRNRTFVMQYLLEHPCVDCQEPDPLVLQFDHQHGKVADVSKMINTNSLAKIKEEILKCEVVCANCHTRRTATTFGWWKLTTHASVD